MGLERGDEDDAQVSGLGNWMMVMPPLRKRRSSRFEERHEKKMSSILDMLNLKHP